MFEINTEAVRREGYIFSDASNDLRRYAQELRNIQNELSALSDMKDIEIALSTIATEVLGESRTLYVIGDSLSEIVRNYDDTEDLATDRIKCINYLDFGSSVSMGYFDHTSPRAKPDKIDMSVMKELTLMIS